MRIKKLPLAQRLERLNQDRPVYPEHTAHIIRRVADMPITSYMMDCPAEQEELQALLKLSQDQTAAMTYADVAAHINRWYVSYSADKPQRHAAAIQAAERMAAPLLKEYRRCMPPSKDDDSDFEEV